MSRLLAIGFLCVLVGCVGDSEPTINAGEGYDSFGESISPDDAIPVQLIASEGRELIGKTVKLEGRITEVCQGNGCWLTMQVVDGPMIRVDVPRDDEGAYVYTFPKDASGRRAILAGILESTRAHHETGEDGDHHDQGGEDHHDEGGEDHHDEGGEDHHDEGGEDHHDEGELDQSPYTLIATGALLERVRA